MIPERYDELSQNLQKDVARLERRQRLFVSRRLAGLGYSGVFYRYIMTIHRHPGTNLDFLAEFHSVDKSRITRVVRELELQGFVDRRLDETNRRSHCLNLTDKGKALNKTIHAILSEWGRLVSSGIPSDELQISADTLARMVRNSDEI